MFREPTYQAARAVAAIVEAHFARHLTEARQRDERELAHAPDARAIETIIDATFWASFRPEEGRFPKISLAFLPPEQAINALKSKSVCANSGDPDQTWLQQSSAREFTWVSGMTVMSYASGEPRDTFRAWVCP